MKYIATLLITTWLSIVQSQSTHGPYLGVNIDGLVHDDIIGALNYSGSVGFQLGYRAYGGNKTLRFGAKSQASLVRGKYANNIQNENTQKLYLELTPQLGYQLTSNLGLYVGPVSKIRLWEKDIFTPPSEEGILLIGLDIEAIIQIKRFLLAIGYNHDFTRNNYFKLTDEVGNPIGTAEFKHRVFYFNFGIKF